MWAAGWLKPAPCGVETSGMRHRFPIAFASAALTITPCVGGAQAAVAADVAFNSQYVWRGVTSTNRPVLQPDLSIAVPFRRLTFTTGAWGNVEPVRYDGPRDLSSLGGLPGPLVTQSEFWAELATSLTERMDASLGAQGYFYPHVGDLADYDTVELYSTLTLNGRVSPTVTVSYDVARIRGAYVETSVSSDITGDRHGSVTVGLAAGYSAGQSEDPQGRDVSYFARDGLTHLDGSVSASVAMGPVAFAPEAHVIYAHDALATVVAPDATRRVKLWVGTTLRWTTERTSR